MTDDQRSLMVATPSADPDRPVSDAPRPERDAAPQVETELLVEEVSIDGMCGVY
jgi:mycofactocin precursor